MAELRSIVVTGWVRSLSDQPGHSKMADGGTRGRCQCLFFEVFVVVLDNCPKASCTAQQ
jgi:hypothetical protein